MKETRETIRAFMSRFFDVSQIKDSENLQQTGLINSLFYMQLILFLEKEFDVTVGHEQMNAENFSSMDAIVRFVESNMVNISE